MRTARGLTLLVLVVGCGRESPAPRQPETVLLHGKIFTGSATEFADALLVRGTRIAEVGPAEDVVAKAAPDARRIDLMGRLVIPGINDAHLHMDFTPEHTALQFEGFAPITGKLK